MSSKGKRPTAAPPRYPERKWGPFHGGLGVAVWLNQVETDDGPRFFRSISIAPRRFLDKKSGKWKDASSLRPADLPVLQLALAAAHEFLTNTPLPGQSIEPEELEDPSVIDNGVSAGSLP